MTPNAKVALPHIDLEYRPRSYFWPLTLETHLLGRIKGAERRAMSSLLLETDQLTAAPKHLTDSALTTADRQAFGRIHPSFLGGEFLPDLKRDELEIARITIASVTQDVTSVYARRGKHRIYYAVVDDYGGETLSGRTRRTSIQPLKLGELESFMNGAWPIFDVLDMNFDYRGYPLESMLRFVSVESQCYPQMGELYQRRITAWAIEQHAGLPPIDRGCPSTA